MTKQLHLDKRSIKVEARLIRLLLDSLPDRINIEPRDIELTVQTGPAADRDCGACMAMKFLQTTKYHNKATGTMTGRGNSPPEAGFKRCDRPSRQRDSAS